MYFTYDTMMIFHAGSRTVWYDRPRSLKVVDFGSNQKGINSNLGPISHRF